MFSFIKKTGIYILGVVLLTAAFFSGVYVGYSNRPEIEKTTELFNKDIGKPPSVDFSPFWKAWNILNEKYASDNGFDEQNMVWGAISGLTSSFSDPYTVFFPPVEKKAFEEEVKGSFSGVGMEIGIRKNILTVIAPLKDSPAERAGIRAGDMILKVDGKETANMTIEQAVRLIRGEKGTEVILAVFRDGNEESKEFKITRDIINIPIIDTEIKDGNIFVIKLYNFSERSPQAMREALRKMALSGKGKLVLDLRSNPGGYLEAAVDIASWFLPMGEVVAREQFADGKEVLYRSKGYDGFQDIPMIILINQGSASASEILAGALKEHSKAKLVGEKTFGKGSVQELVPVTRDTALKITIARWLTPRGASISKEGLEPDYKIELTKDDFESGRDPQTEKAIELLR